MKVLVVLGHPRVPSFCGALAEAYAEGVRVSGHDVRLLDLGNMRFDLDVRLPSPRNQSLEPDLAGALQLITWADHVAFVFPAWWGVGPARLRGFLDRVLLPGVAFEEGSDGRYIGLLSGRTAHLVITMDMPPWIYRLIYRSPGITAMKRSVLGFCGIKTTRVLALGPVKRSTDARRAAWLEEARALGFSLRNGPFSPAAQRVRRITAWLKALRLQFYPFTWMAYTLGAIGATHSVGQPIDHTAYWVGYVVTFFVEAATVFINEYRDFETDKRNRNFGPFNGGSRVLVDGQVSAAQLRVAAAACLVIAVAGLGWLVDLASPQALPLGLLGALMLVLGPGYTASPLKLSWRGLGELDVAFTHSFGVLVFGHLVQGGEWSAPLPWLLSVPLFTAVLPAIILSGVPDADADADAGKRTLVVRLGLRGGMMLAWGLVFAAALAATFLRSVEAVSGALSGMLAFVLPHALLLCMLLYRDASTRKSSGRIDLLMVVSLSYILWFVAIPLFNLF